MLNQRALAHRWRKVQNRSRRSGWDLRLVFVLVLVGLLCFEGVMFFRSSSSDATPSPPPAAHEAEKFEPAEVPVAQRRRFEPIGEAPPDAVAGGGGLRGGRGGDTQAESDPMQHNRNIQGGDNEHVMRAHNNDGEDVEQDDGMPIRIAHAAQDDKPEPDLIGLMQRVGDALSPFQRSYLDELARKSGKAAMKCNKGYGGAVPDSYLSGCPMTGCSQFDTLDKAQSACDDSTDCGGVIKVKDSVFEIRSSNEPESSGNGEVSYPKILCWKKGTAQGVWDSFRKVISEALDDDTLHLRTSYGPPRKDDSIYLSIASYRDPSCRPTLHQAFERAANPDNLFVGIVQQNCIENCMTGTGWGSTRRWVSGPPDPDCASEFCASEKGRKYCENGQVRILRLPEKDSLGPFFTRYLNSKLWRGETYYMQIDSHTEFRSSWDESLVLQMRRTPSYPYSVLSNYPPSGTPENSPPWPKWDGKSTGHAPASLCGCTFEDAGGTHQTVRLTQISRQLSSGVDHNVPHHSLFVAAGFFFAHGSIVDRVPFDPFMPYLFMGEEIALSVRFWTSGYDIYAPVEDVLRHEYVRKEHPKFWESVTMIYSNGGMHNALTDMIIQRMAHLVGFPEAKQPGQVEPRSLLTRMDEFNLGTVRPIEQYFEIAELNVVRKTQRAPQWCRGGVQPTYVSSKAMVEAAGGVF